MSKITALLQKMKSLCNSNNGKDTFNSPVTAEEISDWDTKLSTLENRYYSQFTAMEKAMASMQSKQNALSSYLG